MITSRTSNSITISTDDNGKFDSTYPSFLLHGIISRDEYEQSIYTINDSLSSGGHFCNIYTASLGILIGFLMAIIGLVSTQLTFQLFFCTLGFGLFLISFLCFTFECSGADAEYEKLLSEEIAEESAKYSIRSPICCRWKFKTGTISSSRAHQTTRYHIVMTIQPNVANNFNINPSQTILNLSEQDDTLPPAYSSLVLLNISQQDDTRPPPYHSTV